MSEGGRGRRQPNFSREEIDMLLSSLEKAKPILFGPKLTPSALNNEVRNQAWVEITSNVNSTTQGQLQRAPHEVQKKWNDLLRTARKKYNDPDNKQMNGPLTVCDRRVMKLMGMTPPDAKGHRSQDPGGKMEVEDPDFEEDSIFAVMEEDDDLGPSTSHDLGNLATPGVPTLGDVHDPSAADIGGDVSEAGNPLCLENGSFSKQNESTKRKRIIRNSDIVLAIKRKKLRLMEERLQLEKERLSVEKQILETLKDLKTVQTPQGF